MKNEIPKIGLGTWDLTGDAGASAIRGAIAIGYRHIDTAQSYGTEDSVGKAVAESEVPRDDIFITTKIADTNLNRIEDSLRESLSVMSLDHVDLALIHWPLKDDAVPMQAYLGELARVQDKGLTRLIGVSNFNRKLIDRAVSILGEGRISTNQVECHPYLQNKVLARHCSDAGIPITAYLPIARGKVGNDPIMKAIAHRHRATPEQVALAFLVQRGHIAIPKSANPDRQRTNLAALSIVLSDQDLMEIDGLDRGERFIDPEKAPQWD